MKEWKYELNWIKNAIEEVKVTELVDYKNKMLDMIETLYQVAEKGDYSDGYLEIIVLAIRKYFRLLLEESSANEKEFVPNLDDNISAEEAYENIKKTALDARRIWDRSELYMAVTYRSDESEEDVEDWIDTILDVTDEFEKTLGKKWLEKLKRAKVNPRYLKRISKKMESLAELGIFDDILYSKKIEVGKEIDVKGEAFYELEIQLLKEVYGDLKLLQQ